MLDRCGNGIQILGHFSYVFADTYAGETHRT